MALKPSMKEPTPDQLFNTWWKEGKKLLGSHLPLDRIRAYRQMTKISFLAGLAEGTRLSSVRMGIRKS